MGDLILGVIFIIAVIMIFMFGMDVGRTLTSDSMRAKAVKQGYGEYIINPERQKGVAIFRWKECNE